MASTTTEVSERSAADAQASQTQASDTQASDTRARLTAAWRSAADRMAGAAYPQALIAETMLLVAAERLADHYGEAVVADFLHMAEEDMRARAAEAEPAAGRQGAA